MVTLLLRLGALLLMTAAIGCFKPQAEEPGAQTPAERAVPPETANYMDTDGPTNPRSSAARPPTEKGHDD